MTSTRTFAVIGGGVSGIAAAHYLEQRGFDVELFEQSSKLGGRIGSSRLGERWLDFGGKNIGKHYRLFREFTRAMGDNPYEYFGINSSQIRNGEIVTFDSTKRWRTMLALLRQCSARDLVRFASLCLRVKLEEENGYLGSRYFNALGRRLDGRPAGDYFNDEFSRRMLRPMTVRMNGAEPDEVYMGNLGANIRMILDSYDQLERGMNRVLDQFASTIEVRLEHRVEALTRENGRVAGVRYTNGVTTEEREFDGIVVALRALEAARLVEPIAPALAGTLEEVRYYPVALVLAQYSRDIFTPEVRALVFGDDEVLSNAGSYGINDLDIVRYTFSGRAARELLAGSDDPEAWLSAGEAALDRYIPVAKDERVDFVSQRFDLGLCAYAPNFADFADRTTRELSRLPGLSLTGDYLRGASIEACFRAARDCVEGINGG